MNFISKQVMKQFGGKKSNRSISPKIVNNLKKTDALKIVVRLTNQLNPFFLPIFHKKLALNIDKEFNFSKISNWPKKIQLSVYHY